MAVWLRYSCLLRNGCLAERGRDGIALLLQQSDTSLQLSAVRDLTAQDPRFGHGSYRQRFLLVILRKSELVLSHEPAARRSRRQGPATPGAAAQCGASAELLRPDRGRAR